MFTTSISDLTCTGSTLTVTAYLPAICLAMWMVCTENMYYCTNYSVTKVYLIGTCVSGKVKNVPIADIGRVAWRMDHLLMFGNVDQFPVH